MTENKTQKKNKKGLGRGLGSLIGENTKVNSFSEKQHSENSKAKIVGKIDFQKDKNSALSQGFQEPEVRVVEKIVEKPVEKIVEQKIPDTSRIWSVDISKIVRNKKQPRKDFEKQALEELAASIKEKGVLQPIVCRKLDNGSFEIVAGERRWRASQLAELREVPVILKEASNQEALELALIENIQRQDLNPIEEAEAYNLLAKEYNLTQQQLADKTGKDRATVANVLRLLNLSTEVRAMVSSSELSLGQAKVLLSVADEKAQRKLARKIAKDKLSVRATEKLVKNYKLGGSTNASSSSSDENKIFVKELSQQLQKTLGRKVTIDYNQAKGKVSLYFYSDAELNDIAEKVQNAWK
jgi:ParB family chromosome partitioning protein